MSLARSCKAALGSGSQPPCLSFPLRSSSRSSEQRDTTRIPHPHLTATPNHGAGSPGSSRLLSIPSSQRHLLLPARPRDHQPPAAAPQGTHPAQHPPYLPPTAPPRPFPPQPPPIPAGHRCLRAAAAPAPASLPKGSASPPSPRTLFKPAPFKRGSRQAPNYGSMAKDEKPLSKASCFLSLFFYFIFFSPFQGSSSLPSREVKELKTNSETDNRVTEAHKKEAEALEKAGIRCIRDFCRGSWE